MMIPNRRELTFIKGGEQMFECAFIYVAPGLNPAEQRAVIPSSDINMNVVGCATYSEAVEVAKEMVAKGCTALELCAGFGNEGIAMIKRAVGPDIAVGAIKFDFHPAFGFRSGDELFDDTKETGCCCEEPTACESCSMEYFCSRDGEKDAPLLNPDGKKTGSGEKINLKEWMRSIR